MQFDISMTMYSRNLFLRLFEVNLDLYEENYSISRNDLKELNSKPKI